MNNVIEAAVELGKSVKTALTQWNARTKNDLKEKSSNFEKVRALYFSESEQSLPPKKKKVVPVTKEAALKRSGIEALGDDIENEEERASM